MEKILDEAQFTEDEKDLLAWQKAAFELKVIEFWGRLRRSNNLDLQTIQYEISEVLGVCVD